MAHSKDLKDDWKRAVGFMLEQNKLQESTQTDLVLVYRADDSQEGNMYREKFFSWIQNVGINIRDLELEDGVLVELNVPLFLLCKEGSRNGIRVATKHINPYKTLLADEISKLFWFLTCFKNDNFSDKFSIQLSHHTIEYVEFGNPYVFRPATRSLLTYYLLNSFEITTEMSKKNKNLGSIKGLNFMLDKGYLTDVFLLHDYGLKESENVFSEGTASNQETYGSKELYDAWKKRFKFQPVNMVRNYFGEQIALYFAWCDFLIMSLWIPMIFGLITFLYGCLDHAEEIRRVFLPETNMNQLTYWNLISGPFDNSFTFIYVIVVALWATLFLELWKRQNARLVYLWDVKSFEDKEPDRPQYKNRTYLLFKWYWLRFGVSVMIILCMICLAFAVIALFVLYRVVVSVDLCNVEEPFKCFFMSEVLTAIYNYFSIVFLGRVYRVVAYKLTEWENYRTMTEFNDSMIIKIFAFEFANSYAACFYVAFVRKYYNKGIFGLSYKYNDVCETCMPMLSLQVFILMMFTPVPKFATDFLFPYIKRVFKRPSERENLKSASLKDAKSEYLKEPLQDFTMEEYTEKVVLYGYLMLFAASFPLAPLVAMITMRIDIRIDSKRLLYIYKRPIPFIAEDIGMWYDILNFINSVGVVVNAFLIAFTSSFGDSYTTTEKLIFVLIFENLVFGLKNLIAIIIPDIPISVRRAKRKDVFQYAAFTSYNDPRKYFEFHKESISDEFL